MEQWHALWLASPQGQRCARVIDDTPPSDGHVGLNAYLARIKVVDSALCPTCLIPETPSHFLFTCRRFASARHSLRKAVKGPLCLRTTVGDVKARSAVLEYVEATGRFEAYGVVVE
ncbi:hypothetical protein BV20DRAFT_970314 [Pilatotrama ljubarskyi]|nr:hypothetical protein BV20DRAFT_970314 [Pilatotrama ljubarskyi]